MIITSLQDERFGTLFADFQLSAFRLETLQHYDVSYEEGPFRDYLDGVERYTHPDQAAYAELVLSKIRSGATMRRVHVITEPVSDYIRFEVMWPYLDSVNAGEDVRVILVGHGGWPEGVPHLDFWLFDETIAAIMNYGPGGEFVSAEITQDAETIERCIGWRDAALHQSQSYHEAVATLIDRTV